MQAIYFLIPLTVRLLVVAVAVFFWAVRNGQFDDLESPAFRILLDDDRPQPESKPEPKLEPKPDSDEH
jgi:cbb3-type cytochrome oxidase maturation protein